MVGLSDLNPFGSSDDDEKRDSDDERIIWTFDLDNLHATAPAVVDGSVYVTETTSNSTNINEDTGRAPSCLYSLDAETGKEEWRAEVAIEYSPPVCVGGYVFVTGHSVEYTPFDENPIAVFAFDAETGEEQWRHRIGDEWTWAPTAFGGWVFVGLETDDGESSIIAFDAETGEEQWRRTVTVDGTSFEQPTIYDGIVFGHLQAGGVEALNAATGEQLWTQTFEGDSPPHGVRPSADPLYAEFDNQFVLFNRQSGAILDSNPRPDWVTVSGERTYFGEMHESEEYIISAFDTKSGDRLMTAGIYGGPVVWLTEGEELLYGRQNRNKYSNDPDALVAFEIDTGDVRFTVSIGDQMRGPTVANGIAYAGSANTVVAVDTGTNDHGWDWRTYNQLEGHHDQNVATVGGEATPSSFPVHSMFRD